MIIRYALAEAGSPASAVAEVERRWGGVDVLIAGAVRRIPRRSPVEHFEHVPSSVWQSFLTDNLYGTIATVSAAVPGMRERGWGRIVLVSSHVVRDGQRGQEFYAAAKSALHGFARSLAWDVSSDGIMVNVVCPGLTSTAGVLANLPGEVLDSERRNTPSGRLSSPGEVAEAIVFLASTGNLTGEIITVAGGR